MRFGLLGPLLIRDADAEVEAPAPRQRVLLAALLIRAGSVVPADELTEMMWDGAPRVAAAGTLRSHVMRLRRTLGPRAAARLVTRYPGYLIQAGEEEVDVLRFARLCRDGGAALRAGDPARAAQELGEALGLWRGAPLADIPCELLRQNEAPGLERQRLQALEWRNEAKLRLGRHDEVVPELEALTEQHPLQERFRAQLMLALYRSGRQAEALAAYQRARAALAEELGTEPGAELSELHQRMLSGRPGLAAPPAPAPALAGVAGPVTPRQLPAPVPHFVGRADELARLNELVGLVGRARRPSPGAAVIAAIGGTAGVGKTALAVHWAHRVAERFPDGQLYVDLRGYDPGQPMPAADALALFLRALGLPGRDIPAEAGERAASYRSLLAGRRVLVLLDNAGLVDQVRPLLPGSPACAVVVTSRDSLAGLVARDGATRLDLGPLPTAEAAGLLRTLIGRRADEDDRAVATMAGQCSRLPLALRVAAELAVTRPAVPLAELARELADQQRRLDMLDAGGDPRTAVRAVFSWSYRHLDPEAARAFRLLSLHPGRDLDTRAAAALLGGTAEDGRRLLDRLVRAHLFQPAEPGRYNVHDLLRAYARELAARLDTEDERAKALGRLFDYYLSTAAAAMDTLYPAERYRRPRIAGPAVLAPVVDAGAARAWLDAERDALVAAAAHAAGPGWPEYATRLAPILFRYLDAGGYHPEAIAVYTHARRAARQLDDRSAEATALVGLGVVHARQGRFQEASGYMNQALASHRATGNRVGLAIALANRGVIDVQRGRYRQAAGHLAEALALAREAGDRGSQARALSNLGLVRQRQGRYEEAAGNLAEALALTRQTGNRVSEAYALASLGHVDLRRKRYRRAAGRLLRALSLFRETGDRVGEGYTLNVLGDTRARQGDYGQAVSHLRHALDVYRQTSDRGGQAEALNSLGEALFATGDATAASAQHAAALGMAGQISDTYQQARAHEGLARTGHAAGDTGPAPGHLRRALALYAGLGVPEADRVRGQLAALADQER